MSRNARFVRGDIELLLPYPVIIKNMGYLLHSGDPKILWSRTARLARRPKRTRPPFALEASGAVAHGRWRHLAARRRAARGWGVTAGPSCSKDLALPGERQPRPQPVVAT